MAELFKVNAPVRKPLFEGVQGENEARSIQFDITPWVDELGDGAVTATAKRSQDSQPYPVTVTKDGTTVTWKPTSTDTAFAGVGSFQLEYTVDSVLAKTCIWSTMVAPSLDPAGDPPDPYDNWLAEMRQVAADALQSEQNAEDSAEDAEAWAVGQRGGVDVPSTDPTYENNAKYWAEQSLANQYGAYIVKSASGDIASFADGADDVPMKSLKVAIVPQQAGSGDPSPDNVRPITGTSTANVTVTGINLFDNTGFVKGRVDNGNIGYAGGTTEITITDTGVTFTTNTDYRGVVSGKISAKENTQYCLRFDRTAGVSTAGFVDAYDSNDVWLGRVETVFVANPSIWSFTTPSNCAYVRLSFQKVTGGTVSVTDIAINYPSTDREYHAYNGHTNPVPLGQTVYGGTVNPISGELVIDTAYTRIKPTWTWQTFDLGGGKLVHYTYTIPSELTGFRSTGSDICVCDTFKGIKLADRVNYNKSIYTGSTGYAIRYDEITTAADFVTFLTNNNVYATYLITPTTVQLTPTQVATLLGTNNVWSDAGSVAVEYRADPTLAYAELEALILENI